MAVCKPLSFSDVQQAADYLCNNQSTVIDLTEISIEDAQRALDYLSGVVFAINGKASRVGAGIFLFAPANVSIEGAVELMMEQKTQQEQTSTGAVSEETIAFLKTVGA
jgi:cell division inhibitor SepF